MSTAYNRTVRVLNASTLAVAGDADRHLVLELAASSSPRRTGGMTPGLDAYSSPLASMPAALERVFASQPALLEPVYLARLGRNITVVPYMRGIHISRSANMSAFAPNVTVSMQPAGYTTAEDVAWVAPASAMSESRLNSTSVQLVVTVQLDASKISDLLTNATRGEPGVYGVYTSNGALGGKIAGALIEDVSDLPAVLASPDMPRLASNPNVLLCTSGLAIRSGDGLFVGAGLGKPGSSGRYSLATVDPADASPVRAMLSDAWQEQHPNAVRAGVIFGFGGRQYLVTLISAPDHLATELPPLWPNLLLGFGATVAIATAMYLLLWLVQRPRRDALKRQQEAELQEKTMLSVQNDVMALLSHEVRSSLLFFVVGACRYCLWFHGVHCREGTVLCCSFVSRDATLLSR
jgi:hypothetical protein